MIRRLVLFFVLLAGAGCAFAGSDYPATLQWYISSKGPYPMPTDAACADLNGPSSSYVLFVTANLSYQCKGTATNGNIVYVSWNSPTATCPYGGTLVTSGPGFGKQGETYTCTGGSPPPPPCSDTNPFNRKFYYTKPGGPFIAPDHYLDCVVVPDEMLVCRTDSTGTYCWWVVHRTGTTYAGNGGVDVPGNGGGASGDSTTNNSDPKTTSPPLANPSGQTTVKPGFPNSGSNCPEQPSGGRLCVPCPKGTVQAGMDSSGIPICMGSGTNPPDSPKTPTTSTGAPTTTTNADGSTTTTQSTVQTNSDGSKTTVTTTTVTAVDGSKTVSQSSSTTNSSAGTPGRTDTPDTDKYNLCKQNPDLTICRNSTVTGTCSDVACTGDAIQCATLRAAAAMQCQQQKDADDLKATSAYTLGSSVLSGSDPAASSLPTKDKASAVSMPSFDQSGWLGGGSFFPDKTITVQGRTIVIEFSKYGQYLLAFRYALMVVALLVSFKIVSGAVIRD